MSPLSNDWRSSNQLLERCTWWSCRLWSCLTLTPVTAAGAARRSDTDIQRQNRTSFILYSSFIWKKNKNVMRNQCPASPTLKLNTFGLVWGQRWRQFYCHKLKERKVLTVVYSETFLHFTSKKKKKKNHMMSKRRRPTPESFHLGRVYSQFPVGPQRNTQKLQVPDQSPIFIVHNQLYNNLSVDAGVWPTLKPPNSTKKRKKKKKAFGFFCSVGNAAC